MSPPDANAVARDADAHSGQENDNVEWGALMARKGGAPKARVLKALGLDQFRTHLQARRGRGATP